MSACRARLESLAALFEVPSPAVAQLLLKHPALAAIPPNVTITRAKQLSLALRCSMARAGGLIAKVKLPFKEGDSDGMQASRRPVTQWPQSRLSRAHRRFAKLLLNETLRVLRPPITSACTCVEVVNRGCDKELTCNYRTILRHETESDGDQLLMTLQNQGSNLLDVCVANVVC